MKWVQLGREVQNHYQREKALKDKNSLPVHHKMMQHLASDLQKTDAPWPQWFWGLFGSKNMFCSELTTTEFHFFLYVQDVESLKEYEAIYVSSPLFLFFQ